MELLLPEASGFLMAAENKKPSGAGLDARRVLHYYVSRNTPSIRHNC